MLMYFKKDLKAGFVVFLVALPLSLGIALAQGAPLISGIISGAIGGIIVAAISKSNLSISGPAAGLTSLVIASIYILGSFEVFLVALCMAGVLQIVYGLIRAGVIAYYIPSSVIKGMLAAIGMVLMIKQIPHFIGYDINPEGDETFWQKNGENTFSQITHINSAISYPSLILGIVSVGILLLYNRKKISENKILGKIPPALLLVVLSVLLNQLGLRVGVNFSVKPEHLVNLPHLNSMADIQQSFRYPDFSAYKNLQVYEVAFVLSLVSSMETLLNIEAVDKIDPENNLTPTNRELIAQGSGNVLCGLLGGLPLTSVIVRSSANVNAGGKTRMASMVHGLLFIFSIVCIPGIICLIPLSTLAALLLVTGYKLCSPKVIRSVYKQGMDQFIPFAITIVMILISDLLIGVSVGLVVSVFYILKRHHRFPFKIMWEQIDGKQHCVIKFSQQVTFLNKGKIMEAMQMVEPNAKVYIDAKDTLFMDKDVLEIIHEFKRKAASNNIEVHTENIPEMEFITK